ncbi:MAG: hypothetical protein ACTHNS_09345 [Marmoricola sp.]
MVAHLALLLTFWVDKTPAPNDVKAGWGAFGIFILLGLAVAFLGWSLSRQLKKAQRSADEGRYDPSTKKPRRTTI